MNRGQLDHEQGRGGERPERGDDLEPPVAGRAEREPIALLLAFDEEVGKAAVVALAAIGATQSLAFPVGGAEPAPPVATLLQSARLGQRRRAAAMRAVAARPEAVGPERGQGLRMPRQHRQQRHPEHRSDEQRVEAQRRRIHFVRAVREHRDGPGMRLDATRTDRIQQ